MKIYRRIITVLLTVFILISFSAVAFADDDNNISLSETYRDHTGYTMAASRKGCWENAPENSVKAIKAAENAGADIVEIDVRTTADGTLILMSDDTVTRTCYGYGENIVVAEMTYDEIKSLKLLMGEGGVNAEKTNETVPTLESVFKQRRIDVLSSSSLDPEYPLLMIDADWSLRDEIYNLANEHNMLSDIIFYIDDAKTDEIADWKASLPYEPMVMTYFKGNVIFAATSKVKSASEISDCIHLATKNPYGVVFGETVQTKAVNSGIRTMASPCMPEICGEIMQDTEEWWDYLISQGFSIIMTDHVAELKKYIAACEAEKEKLHDVYTSTVSEWKLPDFNSDSYHDYKLAYTNAVSAADAIFADSSNALSDVQQTAYELRKAYDDINANYDDFKNGTAGMTVTPVRILLSVLAIAAVTCAEIYVYKKKKKS